MQSKNLILIPIILLPIIITTYFLWQQHCEIRCQHALIQADTYAQQKQFRQAVLVINQADRYCHCSRYTNGDAPPEYSAVLYYLRQLVISEGKISLADLRKMAQGPILCELLPLILKE
jgi:hypothetical protein